MTDRDLELLRGAWVRAVKIERGGEPDFGNHFRMRMKKCWFAGGGYGPCEGWTEGAHWIKRQTVEGWFGIQLRGAVIDAPEIYGAPVIYEYEDIRDLISLAAWDPRNGVAACERHHRIFDSQRVPLPSEQIVVPRLLVPDHVEEFAADWGLEHELERKHPA